MQLRELLNTLRGGVLRDTSDRVSGDSDQLWSDTSLIGFIDQAQRRFARRSLCIRDATSPVSRFVTVPGQQDYTLDPTVIAVTSIRNLGNGTWTAAQPTMGSSTVPMAYVTNPLGAIPVYPARLDLARVSHDLMRGRGRVDLSDHCSAWDVNSPPLARPGTPVAWESDEVSAEANGSAGVTSIRLHPIPDVLNGNCVMQMRVARLPMTRLTPDSLDAVPEIPEDYHLDMLDYAAYLALRIVDHEAGDAERAEGFRQSFAQHVEEARTEIDRKRFAPMRWSFGGNGFAYPGN